jgi:hypothetical protein
LAADAIRRPISAFAHPPQDYRPTGPRALNLKRRDLKEMGGLILPPSLFTTQLRRIIVGESATATYTVLKR